MKMSRLLFILLCALLISFPVCAEVQLGDRILAYGSWGADVFYLQRHLVQIGYELVVDGHFGSQTRRAVTAFQLSRSLKPDAVVGPETVQALLTAETAFIYTVRPGDSVWKIAKDFNVKMKDIIEINGLSDGPLYVGQKLEIPMAFRPVGAMPSRGKPSLYIVQPGDTLSQIAAVFNTTIQELVARNEIANPSLITVGQEIFIP